MDDGDFSPAGFPRPGFFIEASMRLGTGREAFRLDKFEDADTGEVFYEKPGLYVRVGGFCFYEIDDDGVADEALKARRDINRGIWSGA
jgi:hypothetical protein